jgi:N-methylhydantoinase A/oxoprolinase/acetone carboxylase beta subunit
MALGGDSEIRASVKHGILIGPERVTPICFAGLFLPSIKAKMEKLGEARFLMAVSGPLTHLTPSEKRIIDQLLMNGPQTISELKKDLEDINLLDMFVKSLIYRGALMGIGLTPTDILHAARLYTAGDVEAADTAVGLFSKVLKLNQEEFIKNVMDKVSTKIASELLKKVLSDNLGTLTEVPSMQGVIELLTGARSCYNLELNAKIKGPIVGLGGPAKAFVTPLADILDVEVLIPDDYDVGNAVGAVCGQVSMFADIFVYPRDKGYAVYSAFTTPACFSDERDAIREAKDMARKYAMERARQAGGLDLHVEMAVEEERERSTSTLEKDQLLQMHIRARAVGKPETL